MKRKIRQFNELPMKARKYYDWFAVDPDEPGIYRDNWYLDTSARTPFGMEEVENTGYSDPDACFIFWSEFWYEYRQIRAGRVEVE